MIKSYLYRRPSYLAPIDPEMIDTIVIHHTGNNNSMETNTDYHMDVNGWNWLGYGFVVSDGQPYKVRGFNYMNAAVLGHNDRKVSVAVKGDFNSTLPSDADIEATQEIIDYCVKHLPNVKYLKGHRELNDTSCPGKLFPIRKLRLKEKKEIEEYVPLSEYNILKKIVEKNERELRYLKNAMDKRLKRK